MRNRRQHNHVMHCTHSVKTLVFTMASFFIPFMAVVILAPWLR